MFIINQILSAFVVLNKCGTHVSNKILDYLDNITIYTIIHDIVDPFTKTYSTIFIPLRFTMNHSTYSFNFNFNSIQQIQTTNFFDVCTVNDIILKNYISKKIPSKITSDFKKIPYISMSIYDNIFHKLQTLYTDIELTADHICTIMYLDVGTNVLCTDHNLDEITFKDIDVIK
jgi:hypothetical protein